MPVRRTTDHFDSARRSKGSLAMAAALCASQTSVSLVSAYNGGGGSGNARNGNGYNSVSPWGPNSEQALRQQRTQYANYGDNSAAFYPDQMRDRGGQLANYEAPNNNNVNDASFGDNAAAAYGNPEQRRIQGGSRRQYGAYGTRSHVHLSTDGGRPMDSRVQLWDGPDNTSHTVRVWSEDGTGRPMDIGMERMDRWGGGGAHGGYRNGSVDVRNRGPMEYPIQAGVSHRPHQRQQQVYAPPSPSRGAFGSGRRMAAGGETIQGGTVRHFTINPTVSSVRVTLESDGLPIKALVELLQGPGRVAQLAEVYNQHGRTFVATLPTPGYGSTIAVRNDGPMEYPFYASVEPMSMEGGAASMGAGMGMGGGGNRHGDHVSGGSYGGGGYNGGYGYSNGSGGGTGGYGGYQYN